MQESTLELTQSFLTYSIALLLAIKKQKLCQILHMQKAFCLHVFVKMEITSTLLRITCSKLEIKH